MTPCEPLSEEEEGHCHYQVESPIGGRRNAETGAKLVETCSFALSFSDNDCSFDLIVTKYFYIEAQTESELCPLFPRPYCSTSLS